MTKTGQKHWQNLAHKYARPGLVVDIGSNTGALLQFFKAEGMQVRGVDPAMKLVNIARRQGIPTTCSYFNSKVVKKIGQQAQVVTCTNTFDHVADLHEFMRALVQLLDPQGVFVVEVPYFPHMATNLSHLVYHQQLDYLQLSVFVPFFEKYGLILVDWEEVSMHGGSIRLVLQFSGAKKPFKEKPINLVKFAKKVEKQRDNLIKFVKTAKKAGKKLVGIGASAKGVTLLNYAGLDWRDLDFITEKSPLKIGRYTPTRIPLVADGELITHQPDYALLLAWNFADEIVNSLKKYKGKFIRPIPTLSLL